MLCHAALCHAMLCYSIDLYLNCRSASPSLSSKSRLSSSSVPQGLPFGNITNTPASRAATPGPADDVRASGTIKGIPRSGDGSRRRSQGLEDLQDQLQDVLQEGSKMQVGAVMGICPHLFTLNPLLQQIAIRDSPTSPHVTLLLTPDFDAGETSPLHPHIL